MNNEPLISVCIPVYNREMYIADAIDSVLKQSYQNFEIIIVDDGSTDQTFSILRKIKDARIRIYQNGENKGVVYSRNLCLNTAHGKYIATLDSDDLWMPDKLQKQVEFLESQPNYGVCGTWGLRRKPGQPDDIWSMASTDAEIRTCMLWRCPIIHSSMMIRRTVLQDHNIWYDEAYANSEDYELIRRMLSFTNIHCFDEPLVVYHLHDNQISSLKKDIQLKNAERIVENYLLNFGISLTDEERNAFFKIYRYSYSLHPDELAVLRTLFKKILNATHPYLRSTLQTSLSEKFFLTCYFSTQHGYETSKIYHSSRSDLPYNPTIFEKSKFYFKSLFKI